jgi:hypothetical protein
MLRVICSLATMHQASPGAAIGVYTTDLGQSSRRPQHRAPPQIRFDLLLSSLSALDQALDSQERVHVGGSQFPSPPLLEVFVSVGVPPFASIVSLMVVMRRSLGFDWSTRICPSDSLQGRDGCRLDECQGGLIY